MMLRLNAANANDGSEETYAASARSPLLLEWLTRLTTPGFSLDRLHPPAAPLPCAVATDPQKEPRVEDWNAVAHVCGYVSKDFRDAGAPLPLSAAEINYFRRNHRGTENHVSRDFLTAQTDLPSPLLELYGLYRHRARIDAEAALWVAQSTNSTRVASVMADLLAIGGFANGLEYVSYLGVTYSVPCAFDTSAEIDSANREAMRRLMLPPDHPSHFLKLKPDELGVLAASIAEKNSLAPAEFLEKANKLSESRQDVTRMETPLHIATVIAERDIPLQAPWAERMVKAYARVLPKWVNELPEAQTLLG